VGYELFTGRVSERADFRLGVSVDGTFVHPADVVKKQGRLEQTRKRGG
jgi:hypothetical protein